MAGYMWGISVFQRLGEKSVLGNMIFLSQGMAALDKLKVWFVFWDYVGLASLRQEISCS